MGEKRLVIISSVSPETLTKLTKKISKTGYLINEIYASSEDIDKISEEAVTTVTDAVIFFADDAKLFGKAKKLQEDIIKGYEQLVPVFVVSFEVEQYEFNQVFFLKFEELNKDYLDTKIKIAVKELKKQLPQR